MAGHTKRKAVLEDFARRAQEREMGETALDYICNEIGSGVTFRAVCKTSKPPLSEDSIRTELYHWYGEAEVKRRLAEARQRGASSLADKTLEVSEGISDKDQAAAARVEVSSLQWLAGKWDRGTYGPEQKQPQGGAAPVNFAVLLLQAHRAIASGQAPQQQLQPMPAEIVRDGDADAVQDQEGEGRLQGGNEGDGQDPQQEAAQ